MRPCNSIRIRHFSRPVIPPCDLQATRRKHPTSRPRASDLHNLSFTSRSSALSVFEYFESEQSFLFTSSSFNHEFKPAMTGMNLFVAL